jgi:hypothetical protein
MSIRRMIPLGTHLRRCVVCGAQINAKSDALTVHELNCLDLDPQLVHADNSAGGAANGPPAIFAGIQRWTTPRW